MLIRDHVGWVFDVTVVWRGCYRCAVDSVARVQLALLAFMLIRRRRWGVDCEVGRVRRMRKVEW